MAAIDVAFKGDAFTFCIAHRELDENKVVRIVIDYLQGWQGSKRHPVQLSEVLPQIKKKYREYRVRRIHGDQYGAAPIEQALRAHGMKFREVPFTQTSKADIYGTLRTLIVDRKIELLDHPQSLRELRSLEVELMPGGNVKVGHPNRAGAHDDYADVIALSSFQLQQKRVYGVHFGVG